MDFKKIEQKWQKKWEGAKAFQVKEDSKKKKKFILEMYPYPSSSGLHMGHAFNYTIGDVYARFKRMQGFNVLYPMGYDSFGLPAENAAIKNKSHPRKFTENAIKSFVQQQKQLGLSYDWSRMISSCDPEYYKWNQYFFLKFYEKGLVYRKESAVNWCPECNTVLANEQVHNGKCWRHTDTSVEIRNLEQWFIKTTEYAEELLKDIEKLEWPERIKTMQRNWIGKSEGAEIDFEIPTKLNFIQLHGFTANPNEDFHPWLKEELEKRGYKVNVPRLPNTNDPSIKEQVEYTLKNCKFDENSVLLGHSLGSVIALKVLEKLDKPIKKLILIAGFAQPKFKDKERSFEKKFDWKFDFNKIKNNAKEIIILRAENDSAVPEERADFLKEKVGGRIIDFRAEEDHVCGKKEPVVLESCLEKWNVFTTRPDTLFGVTFLVVSAQHPRLMELVTKEKKKEVDAFLNKMHSTKQEDIDQMDKEGVFTGSYAEHPLTKEKIPVYAGNFVLAEYGSGMVMAVPAHDQRDFEFAKKYKIPIKIVIQPSGKKLDEKKISSAYTESGMLVNSKQFDGLNNEDAKNKIVDALAKKKLGRKTVQYKLRDWLISRQRYWGTPIPIIYCDKCGIVPVPEKDLPVLLPEKVMFGEGNPLASNKEFVNTTCPKCKGKARRETDTMDTFMDSSWYYLRYCDPKNDKQAFDKKKVEYWMPVDQYIGGAEHACMHLIYARFFTKALRDFGLLKIDEPFTKLFNQGMLHKDGFVMSKSKGNVVLPEEVSAEYGIDTARLFMMSVASPDKDTEWNDQGIEGSLRFVNKVCDYFSKVSFGKSSKQVENKVHSSIQAVTEYVDNFKYNLAIIKIREVFSYLQDNEISKQNAEIFLKLLHPFCPHVTEEIWEKLGNKEFLTLSMWPEVDKKKIDPMIDAMESFVEGVRDDIRRILKLVKTQPKVIQIFVAPNAMYQLHLALAKEEEKDIKKLMEKYRSYGKDAFKIINQFVAGNLRLTSLTQEQEQKALMQAQEQSVKEFGIPVKIALAEKSKEIKAQQAQPGKPAILIL